VSFSFSIFQSVFFSQPHRYEYTYMHIHACICTCVYICIHIHIHTFVCVYNTYKSKLHQIRVPESHFQNHLQVSKSKRVDGSVSRAESVLHTTKFENARGRVHTTCVFRRILRNKGFGSNRFDKVQNGLEIFEKDSAAYEVCQV